MNRTNRPGFRTAALVLLASLALLGCPKMPNIQVALIVSTTQLDFGNTTAPQQFTVAKSYSSRELPPFSISADTGWITVSPAFGSSAGPSDLVTVTVSIDRSNLPAGRNSGTITIKSAGYVPALVQVTVTQRVSANFSASDRDPFVNNPVQFLDASLVAVGENPITEYLWDFGDGTTSTEKDPLHAYTEIGTYTVSLTVSNGAATQSHTKEAYITVGSAIAPQADFVVSSETPFVGQLVTFTDTSDLGSGTSPEYSWDFGDGQTSIEQSPAHAYTAIGTYTVTLTLTTTAGASSITKEDFLTVIPTAPPVANFTLSPAVAVPQDTIRFEDASTAGSLPIESYLWNFGDGGTSTETDPTHVYTRSGLFTVSLTVTAGEDTNTKTVAGAVEIQPYTALDSYVRRADPTFRYFVRNSNLNGGFFLAHTIELISQSWRTYGTEVNSIGGLPTNEWQHNLTIAEPILQPPNFPKITCLLIISGGSNRGEEPDNGTIAAAGEAAAALGAVVAIIEQVPNEPIVFANDGGRSRTEDEIIAYTFDKYLDNTADADWPLLLPMVKSVVRAMDVVQEYMGTQNVLVSDFVIAGASKRGWTTWLTSAADPKARVAGAVPIVIDMLNMHPSLSHHFRCYGRYSEAIEDYVDEGVMARLATPQGALLRKIVDPYEYRKRLTLPKLIMNATGDQFFVSDSIRFYWNDLLGPKRIVYIPNTDHSLTGAQGIDTFQVAFNAFAPFYNSVANRRIDQMPSVSWTYNETTHAFRIQPSETPASVLVWTAVDDNLFDAGFFGNQRNFRKDSLGDNAWSPDSINRSLDGSYTTIIDAPPVTPSIAQQTWTGFFAEVEFKTGHVFTTELTVRPDVLRFNPPDMGG